MRYFSFLIILFCLTSCSFKEQPIKLYGVSYDISENEISSTASHEIWVTFLSSNIFDQEINRDLRLSSMKAVFLDFGNGIGKRGGALWYAPPADEKDLDLIKNIHDNCDLLYASGPYIIISRIHPYHSSFNKNSKIIFDFSYISPDRVYFILSELQQQIRKEKIQGIKLNFVFYTEVFLSTFNNFEIVDLFLQLIKKAAK